MSNDWLNKAKEAAMSAANSAKEAAKNANLGEMMDKTKNMAMAAADEAKKAAGSVMHKDQAAAAAAAETGEGAVASVDSEAKTVEACYAKLVKVEAMLAEVKECLSKIKQ